MDIDYQSGRRLKRELILRLVSCEYIAYYRNLFITGATGKIESTDSTKDISMRKVYGLDEHLSENRFGGFACSGQVGTAGRETKVKAARFHGQFDWLMSGFEIEQSKTIKLRWKPYRKTL